MKMHAACMPACMIHACSAGMHSLEGKCHIDLGHGQNLILTQVEPYGFVDLGQVQLLLSSTFNHGLRRKHFLVVSVENQFGSDSVIRQK